MINEIIIVVISSLCLSAILAVALALILSAICLILKKDIAKIVDTKRRGFVAYIFCLLLAVSYITMKRYWGTNTIGSFFSREEFETQYYVQLFPEGSESKNYLVPADLWFRDGGLVLIKVYWPDGGFTTFYNNGDADAEEFYEFGQDTMFDDEGREWLIVLTDKKIE